MLHYTPVVPFGELRPFRARRREIGHGALAKRPTNSFKPAEADFTYTIKIPRTYYPTLQAMSSVCGGLPGDDDAGVPIARPVAGISVGLVTGATVTSF
jgi:polyribonucleotide nucleotidyltransferase